MKNKKILFIDETGKHNLTDRSKNFILSGCLIFEDHLEEIRQIANKIIFKYWGSQKSFTRKHGVKNIVFRAKNIADCKKEFIIFRDEKLRKQFWKDIYSQLLARQDIIYIITILDKVEFKNKSPQTKDETILDKSYYVLIEAFMKYLIKSGYTGEIVSESAAEQDIALVKALSFFQRNSSRLYEDPVLVNKKITSLSLVNKNDDNIGAQLADLMAWTGSNKYRIEKKYKKLADLPFEQKTLLEMFNRKIKRIRMKINSQFIVIDP